MECFHTIQYHIAPYCADYILWNFKAYLHFLYIHNTDDADIFMETKPHSFCLNITMVAKDLVLYRSSYPGEFQLQHQKG